MDKPERLSEARATRSIALTESSKLDAWRASLDTGRGELTPMDWFLALAALSNPTNDPRGGEEPVVVEAVGRGLGLGRSRAASDGAVFRRYRTLLEALGEEAIDGAVIDGGAILGLYHQARMATFMPYRDGVARYLREVPITPESAVHVYVRAVTDWASQWRGLTVATQIEYTRTLERRSWGKRDAAHIKFDEQQARISFPLIVGWDLQTLLHLVAVEASNIGSADEPQLQTQTAVDFILGQLSIAVLAMTRDVTLAPLTAANFARTQTNKGLGGALGRMRMRHQDRGIVALEVLEQARRYFLDPIGDNPTAEDVEQRALMAKKFHLLRVAIEAMGGDAREVN